MWYSRLFLPDEEQSILMKGPFLHCKRRNSLIENCYPNQHAVLANRQLEVWAPKNSHLFKNISIHGQPLLLVIFSYNTIFYAIIPRMLIEIACSVESLNNLRALHS